MFDCLFFKFSTVAGDQDKVELPLPDLLSISVKLIVIARLDSFNCNFVRIDHLSNYSEIKLSVKDI